MSGRGPQSDRRLKLSEDRKVSPIGTQQPGGMRAGRWIPGLRNSFGLPAGISCPGKTAFCESCYANRSENYAGVHDAVAHNLKLLQAAGGLAGMATLLGEMVGRYVREADRLGLTGRDRLFRIHWDGDFYSVDYARAWAMVMRAYPSVHFWAYTRSFDYPVDVVPVLAGVDNLALYLSADAHNIDAARRQVAQFPRVRLALCAEDYRSTRELAGGRRAVVCPENKGTLDLMGPDPARPGNGRGACVACQLCPDGRVDVMFSTSHRQDAAIPVRIVRRPTSPPTGPRIGGRRCSRSGCANLLAPHVGQGRPQMYCSLGCRHHASYERAKTRRPISIGEPRISA